MLQKLNENSKGFTLIELMIVIAIIGILAAIAIPNFIAYRSKSYCSGAQSDVESVMGAIAEYFSEPVNISVSKASLGITDGVGGDLSNDNRYEIVPGANNSYTVTVTDVSGRCPLFDTFSKIM
jgi:type IV pilus assembly protein PilA